MATRSAYLNIKDVNDEPITLSAETTLPPDALLLSDEKKIELTC